MRGVAILLAAGVLLAAGIAARVRTQLPAYDRARIHLYLHRQALQELAENLLQEPEIDSLIYFGDELFGHAHTKGRVVLEPTARARYEKLIREAGFSFIAKHQAYAGHAFIELGGGVRFGREFGVMYLFGPGPPTPVCDGQYHSKQEGHCHFPLGDSWYLHYGWTPPVDAAA